MSSDMLFSQLERWQGGAPWGRFLDAGTGVHSLKWIHTLNTTSWSAITADPGMRRQVESCGVTVRSQDRILLGNWMDDDFCASLGQYDTILADYLIGAVDGFSPYAQDIIISKLRQHLAPGGRLYIVGMEPIPDKAAAPADVICDVRRARDSCIMLAGHRPYREFPATWIHRHLTASGLSVVESKNFTILHSEDTILRQIRVGQSKLELFTNSALRQGMQVYLNDLITRVKSAVKNSPTGKIPLSFDYCIAAMREEDAAATGTSTSSGSTSGASGSSGTTATAQAKDDGAKEAK